MTDPLGAPLTGAHDLPPATRRRAALYICDRARDTADARVLLDYLGLLDCDRDTPGISPCPERVSS